MEIRLLQTAETTYRPLLDLTSQTVKEFCGRHGYAYECFFGIVRGYHPWQATYNRILLLKRMVESGYSGWVFYLDADAYINQLDFDLNGYLEDKSGTALIIAPAAPNSPWWWVNAGAFLVNLAHPVGRELVREWSRRFEGIADEQLKAASAWSQVMDDQGLLWLTLEALPDGEGVVLAQEEGAKLLNARKGALVRQALRAGGSLEERVTQLRACIDPLLNGSPDLPSPAITNVQATREAFINALYRVLLRREPDPAGFANALALIDEGRTFEELMRSCMRSEEFARKRRQFVQEFIRADHPTADLTTLADKYGSDKGTRRGSPPHRYTYLYDLILGQYRSWDCVFLELGLAVGGPEVGGPSDRQVISPSVQMWLDYFPRAHVYGFDISDFSHMQHPRFTFVRGDGGSAQDMERLAGAAPGFDIIIDDGSHASYHQQMAFKHLFPKLRPGGTYIIEDLHWQSPTYEGKPIPLPKTRDFMTKFFEGGEYIQNDLLSEDFMRKIERSVASYAWFPAFDGTASPAKLFVLRKHD